MMESWPSQPVTKFSRSLYHAAPKEILETVCDEGDEARRLMVLAHNPGIAELASHFADEYIDMPTAAIAVFSFHGEDWYNVRSSTVMKLAVQMRPKAL